MNSSRHVFIHIRTYRDIPACGNTYACKQMYRYIHAYMHTCTHAYMHTCIHAHMHTCIHAYMHTCIHAYMHTCIHAHMHTCTHANMHTCIHAYMHVFTWMGGRSRVDSLHSCLVIRRPSLRCVRPFDSDDTHKQTQYASFYHTYI